MVPNNGENRHTLPPFAIGKPRLNIGGKNAINAEHNGLGNGGKGHLFFPKM